MNFGTLRLAVHPLVKSLSDKGKILFSRKFLVYTNTAITITLSVTGDLIQQKYQIVHKEINDFDARRAAHVAATGSLIGPFCHYWYIVLDKYLPGRTFRIIMKKLVVDQLICSTVVIGLYLGTLAILEKRTLREMKKEVLGKGLNLYQAEWLVWPPAQIINFYFLPTRFRVLFDNIISFFFDIYFSRVKFGRPVNDDQSKQEDKTVKDDQSKQEDKTVRDDQLKQEETKPTITMTSPKES